MKKAYVRRSKMLLSRGSDVPSVELVCL